MSPSSYIFTEDALTHPAFLEPMSLTQAATYARWLAAHNFPHDAQRMAAVARDIQDGLRRINPNYRL